VNLLEIRNLSVSIDGRAVLHGVDLAVKPGEVVGLAGESGSGKTLTALAVMGLLPPRAATVGDIRFEGRDLTAFGEREWQGFRGRKAGIVFQEPMTALNPLMRIGHHVAEAILAHRRLPRRQAFDRAAELLLRVGLPPDRAGPERHPHELSGGQRQRAMIAAALALEPPLLVADEPTTALDVTTQARILAMLRDRVRDSGAGLLLISHDLGVLAGMADRVAIMRAGRIVEQGPSPALLREARHPYSRALVRAAMPPPLPARSTPLPIGQCPVLQADALTCSYRLPGRKPFRAVDDVSLAIGKGERVGLVGESGCGKSTLARALLGLAPPTEGRVRIQGEDLYRKSGRTRRELRRQLQAVFQDPYGSFNPRHRVGRIVAEPLHLLERRPSRQARAEAVGRALEDVGLDPADAERFPHQFSGGQRQRIAIARALALRPQAVILDEPVSALDVSVRARILDLLDRLNGRFGLGYLFISHDLAVIRAVAERVLVMHAGRVVEQGPTEQVLRDPRHSCTRALIEAAPKLEAFGVRHGKD